MLVLSRRPNEKVVFPGINATVQVVSVKGAVVRLGIEAPPEIEVLREELQDQPSERAARPAGAGPYEHLLRQVRDRLGVAGVGLGTAQLLLDIGRADDVREVLSRLQDDLRLLRYGLDGELEASPRASTPGKSPRALLVEDDHNQRELLAGFLRLGGLEVDTAGDGCDALDYLRSGARPDVVLLDMGLPRCDGATAVRQIRCDPAYAGLRIFAVTGRSPEECGLNSGPGGINRWFRKPLDPAILLDSLREELAFPFCQA